MMIHRQPLSQREYERWSKKMKFLYLAAGYVQYFGQSMVRDVQQVQKNLVISEID